MSTANDAYKRAANSPAAREAVKTAKSIGEDVSEQFGRARDAAVDAYDQVHEASVRNPHLSLAIAVGIGFLFGIVAASRR
jgi:ElaB/YqjD/DUF883 family membrane-anchored ribosome-binding protein